MSHRNDSDKLFITREPKSGLNCSTVIFYKKMLLILRLVIENIPRVLYQNIWFFDDSLTLYKAMVLNDSVGNIVA